MKANEIQIGDWLYYKGPFNAFPFKVESITKKKVGYHAEPNEHRMHYLRLSECKPIPLVPDILEKNGIKADDIPCTFYGYNDYYFEITIEDDEICQSVNYAEYTIFKFEYVHQLQHALRLYGVNKEIEL